VTKERASWRKRAPSTAARNGLRVSERRRKKEK